MRPIVLVFNKTQTETEEYKAWFTGTKKFLSDQLNMVSHTAIRTWEYGVPLSYVSLSLSDICLDTGSYNTYIGAWISQHVDHIYLTDSFEWGERDYIKQMSRPTPKEWSSRVSQISNVSPVQADLRKLQFPASHFDKVFCFSTIEHVPEDNIAMQELWRVLKPGGVLVLTTDISLTGQKYKNFGRVYTPASFKSLIEKGTKISLPDILLPDRQKFIFPEQGFTCVAVIIEKP